MHLFMILLAHYKDSPRTVRKASPVSSSVALLSRSYLFSEIASENEIYITDLRTSSQKFSNILVERKGKSTLSVESFFSVAQRDLDADDRRS